MPRAEIDAYLDVQHGSLRRGTRRLLRYGVDKGVVVVVVADALLKESEGTLGRARSCC